MGQRRHDMRQADAVRSLDQHDIAGTDHVPQPRGSGRVGGHMLEIDAPLKRFGERRHLFAHKQGELHSGCDERSGEAGVRSEEHTSELQSLMRISYAVFCLKKKNITITTLNITDSSCSNITNLHKTGVTCAQSAMI